MLVELDVVSEDVDDRVEVLDAIWLVLVGTVVGKDDVDDNVLSSVVGVVELTLIEVDNVAIVELVFGGSPCTELEVETTGQLWTLTEFESIVTVAPRANAPPFNTAAAPNVIEAPARIFPERELLAPSVAEVPTCQKTLHGRPPPVIRTLEPAAVMRVVPVWKYHASLAEPVPARVKIPVMAADVPKLYVPGAKLVPPRSPVRTVAPLRPNRVLYAEVASLSAVVVSLPMNLVPVIRPGGNPVMEVPAVPISPVMIVGPVLVMLA